MVHTGYCSSEHEGQFFVAYESLPVGVAHLSEAGRILHVNSRLCELTGWSREELLGREAGGFLPRADWHRAVRQALQLQRGQAGGGVTRAVLEVCLKRSSGEPVASRVTVSAARGGGADPAHFIVVVDESPAPGGGRAAHTRLQEGRLRRTLDAARMDVFEYEPGSGRASRQGPLGTLLGLQQDAMGADFFARVHPEDRPGFASVHERLSPEHPDYTFEFRVRTPAGAQLWLMDQARGHFDAQGRLVRVVGICADITQRRHATQALAQERELLKQTLDSIPVMLCLFDAKGRRTLLNRHFEDVLGWSSEDVQSPEDFLGRLYPGAAEREEAERALQSKEPSRREAVITAKDGSRIPCEWSHLRLADDTKIVIGWDLRERRAQEERLARHAERQALLLELTSSMLQAGHDEAALARSVFERIGTHLGADICFNYRADTPTGALHLVAGFGIPTGMRSALERLQPGQSLSSTVAAQAHSLQADATHIAQHASGALMRAMGVRAYVGHPLYARDGRVLGTFALASTRRESFTPEECDFFQMVCHFVTLAWKRIQSERELQKREQQYRLALEAGQLGNWRRELLDSDVYHLDALAQRHYGFDKADVPAVELLSRVHPEDLLRVEQFIARARTRTVGHPGDRIEYRVVHPDGSERWLAVHAKLMIEQRNATPVLVRHGIIADISERKRTEQALQCAMADLRRAQAVAQVGSWRIDARNRRPFGWSEEALRILGLPAGKTVDLNSFLTRVHPEDRQRVQSCWEAALNGTSSYDIEHRVVVAGQVKWVRQKAELEFDREGRLLGGLATVQDLTERKQAEDVLRKSEERLGALADSLPQLVWQANSQGLVEYVNRHNQLLTGNFRNANGHVQWEQTLHPEDLERTSQAWREALRCGTPYEIEHRVRHLDGSYHWYLSRAVPVRDASGTVLQWYGTSTDIQARKQAEAGLQEAAGRMRAILETAVEGILTLDEQGLVDSVNPAIERLFGYGAAELLGRHVEGLIPDLPREALAGKAQAAQQLYELQGQRKDGSLFPLELSISETPLPSRRIFTALVRDITERKTQEHDLRRVASELVEADRCKDQFLATLAHELRNPLGPLRNAAQLLRFEGVGEAHLVWCGHAIERQVRHLTRLVDDLLDASRVSHNMLELRRERITLREVIEGALEGSQPLIAQRQHQLSVELPACEIALEADPVRLTQVFQNLLDNAAKYTPPGGRIVVAAALEEGSVAVSVRDSGLGIPPESLARLFDMFFQVERPVSRPEGGLGIGLTLVQRLVQMHGGSIEACSEGEGHGSTFIVRLPVLAPSPEAEAARGVEDGLRVQ